MVGLCAVTACQPQAGASASATPPPTDAVVEPSALTPAPTPDIGSVFPTQSRAFDRVPPTALPDLGEAPADVVAAVVQDARATLGLAADVPVTIVRAEAVTWPDGSLGCPEPGVSYLAAPARGYWIELEAADRPLDYRVTLDDRFRLCQR